MGHPLDGIRAKLQRGFDHLDELQREERAFLVSGAYGLFHEVDSDTGLHSLRFRAYAEPPIELGVIVGEALYQFRAALDHVLTLAARLRKTAIDEEHFPLCLTQRAFSSASSPKAKSIESRLRAVLRPEHLAIVKRYQPFVQERAIPQQSPFAALAYLNNIDKHAVVHVAYAAPRTSLLLEAQDVVAARPDVLEDGAELYRFRPLGPDVQVKYAVGLSLAYGPNQAYKWITATLLQTMGEMAGWVVGDFAATTPEFGPVPAILLPDEIPSGPTRPDVVAYAHLGGPPEIAG